ncbi:MAG: PleD family two-component response regulator, partial [Bradymonadia bacterium]
GSGVRITVSLGVADLMDSPVVSGQAHPDHVDNFVAVADAKLYEAKHLGRNRVVL